MANVVLVAYVIVAMKEDQSEKIEAEQKAKKAQ
jgi:vacuolar ATPase assembly integral membrane protein VMA21